MTQIIIMNYFQASFNRKYDNPKIEEVMNKTMKQNFKKPKTIARTQTNNVFQIIKNVNDKHDKTTLVRKTKQKTLFPFLSFVLF